jgi:hypothetical protein
MKTYLKADFREWLLNIIGYKLISVSGLIYIYGGEEKISNPHELLLFFDPIPIIQGKLCCSSDGESLVWDCGELDPNDLGEYGETVVKDISYLPCWKNIIGHILKDIKLIVPLHDPCLMGLQLSFENEFSVAVVNLGDEMFMFESLPEKIIKDEHVTFIPLRIKRVNQRGQRRP